MRKWITHTHTHTHTGRRPQNVYSSHFMKLEMHLPGNDMSVTYTCELMMDETEIYTVYYEKATSNFVVSNVPTVTVTRLKKKLREYSNNRECNSQTLIKTRARAKPI